MFSKIGNGIGIAVIILIGIAQLARCANSVTTHSPYTEADEQADTDYMLKAPRKVVGTDDGSIVFDVVNDWSYEEVDSPQAQSRAAYCSPNDARCVELVCWSIDSEIGQKIQTIKAADIDQGKDWIITYMSDRKDVEIILQPVIPQAQDFRVLQARFTYDGNICLLAYVYDSTTQTNAINQMYLHLIMSSLDKHQNITWFFK